MQNKFTIFSTSIQRVAVAAFFCCAFFTVQASGLPVINIQTVNGAEILNRENWVNIESFTLTDPNNPENNVSRVNISPSLDRIRGRGNSTWGAPKKPYRIRFRENVSFFGLPAAENWVLLANWFDATQGIKNSFAFELGSRLGVPHTPSYNFAELYLNGVHQGTYLFTEHRQIAPAGVEPGPGRVDIHPESGWLTEFDFRWDEEDEDPKFRTGSYNLPLVIKGNAGAELPFGIYTNSDHFVVRDWNQLADLMASSSFPENGYRDLIDMQSIVNFFMIQVITQNHDFNSPGSVFFHKNRDGKIAAGPLWDFDLSFGVFHLGMNGTLMNLRYTNFPQALAEQAPNVRPYPTYPFFARFLEDPVFRAMWRESWNSNKAAIYSMSDFIDETADKIRASAETNYSIWRTNENVDFDWWVNEMKNYFAARIDYLDGVYNEYIAEAADLIVEDFTWEPANPQPGDQVIFTATIKNRGGTAVPAGVKLGLRFDMNGATVYRPNSNTMIWSDTHYSGLEPGASVNLTTNGGDSGVAYWTAGAEGIHTVRAYIDDGNLIAESNENNNTLTKEIAVGGTSAIGDVDSSGNLIISYGNTIEIRDVESDATVMIYNTLGTKIYSKKITNNPEIITTLPAGIYLVHIEGTSVVKKVLIVR